MLYRFLIVLLLPSVSMNMLHKGMWRREGDQAIATYMHCYHYLLMLFERYSVEVKSWSSSLTAHTKGDTAPRDRNCWSDTSEKVVRLSSTLLSLKEPIHSDLLLCYATPIPSHPTSASELRKYLVATTTTTYDHSSHAMLFVHISSPK